MPPRPVTLFDDRPRTHRVESLASTTIYSCGAHYAPRLRTRIDAIDWTRTDEHRRHEFTHQRQSPGRLNLGLPMNNTRERITPRRRRVRSVVALVIAVVLGVCAYVVITPSPPSAAPPKALDHTLGVFGVRTPRQAANAHRALDATVAVGTPEDLEARQSGEKRLKIIDHAPQNILYRAVCPHGRNSCHRLSHAELTKLKKRITHAVNQNQNDPAVVGYYLLDDYWFNMRPELKVVGRTIQRISPQSILGCGFGLHIETSKKSVDMAEFRTKLVNYSPNWCNAIMMYSYAPAFPNPFKGHVDWNMSSTLDTAIHELRDRGWSPTNGLLVGVPQAFNFNPRITRSHGSTKYAYRAVTNQQSLRSQVTAFCRAGASAIIAYTWDNLGEGRVQTLSNNVELRKGLREGMSNCQDIWLHETLQPLAGRI